MHPWFTRVPISIGRLVPWMATGPGNALESPVGTRSPGEVHDGSPLSCTGRWIPLGHSDGDLCFREVITRSQSTMCVGVGTVRLATSHGGHLASRGSGGCIVTTGTSARP